MMRANISDSNSSKLSLSKVRSNEAVAVIGVLLVALTVLFTNLHVRTLNNWDEAIYAQIAKEVVHSGNWLTLHWGYIPWFHKPPLFMWLTAIGYNLFGVSEFSARAVSALAGTGIASLVYLIGRRIYSSQAALLAVVVLLTQYGFVHYARFGTTDITLTFFVVLSLYAYLRATPTQPSWWRLWWVAFACGFMTKGVASLVIPAAAFFALLISGSLVKTLRLSSFWQGAMIAALIVLPWHVGVVFLHGQAFIDQYFLYHVVARSTGSIEGHQGGVDFYFAELLKNFFPWVWLLPAAVGVQLHQYFIADDAKKEGSILLVLCAIILGGYTIAGTKLPWYIVPCYPILSLWVGELLSRTFRRSAIGFWSLLAAAAVVCVLTPQRVVFLSSSAKTIIPLLGLVIVAIGVACWHWRVLDRRILVGLLCGLLLLSGVREIRGLYKGHPDPVASLAQSAQNAVNPNNPPLAVVSLSERIYVPTALFYSNRPIYWVRSVADLASFSGREAILAEADLDVLSDHYRFQTIARDQNLIYAKIAEQP
ncbi:MAG: glycosyltransferase family 39 protein [Cyanobacteria bacterium J06648_16]